MTDSIFSEVICGDCVDVMSRMPPECIDLTVTSPPYDNLRKYCGYSFDYRPHSTSSTGLLRGGGGVVVWIVADQTKNGTESCTSFRQALYARECGFLLHDTMIWVKDGGGERGGSNRYMPNFEYMFVFSKGKPKTVHLLRDRKNKYYNPNAKTGYRYNRKGADGVSRWRVRKKCQDEYGKRNNWWHIGPVNFNVGHPAAFPVQLANDHILSWSNEGDVVLDPFMGSGTTGVACMNTNRNFIGIDVSEEYVELARKRINEAAESSEKEADSESE